MLTYNGSVRYEKIIQNRAIELLITLKFEDPTLFHEGGDNACNARVDIWCHKADPIFTDEYKTRTTHKPRGKMMCGSESGT